VGDHGVALQLLGAHLEVPPHQELGEGEMADMELFLDLPPGDALDRLAEGIEDAVHVHVALAGDRRVQVRHPDPEVLGQKLQQSDVDQRLLVAQPHPVPFAN